MTVVPTTPYLRVDLDRLRRNVRRAAEWAATHRVALRPHAKTHKSPEIARLQLGNLPIPKSATPARQRENLDLDGFELTDDEVAAISALARPDGRLFGGDPDSHEEF